MSTFNEQTKEGALAEEFLDTIREFDWAPSLNASESIRALAMILDFITKNYTEYEEIE